MPQEIIDLPGDDRTLGLAFEELYRLGTLAVAMAVMPDGRVVVADHDRQGYHLFGAERNRHDRRGLADAARTRGRG